MALVSIYTNIHEATAFSLEKSQVNPYGNGPPQKTKGGQTVTFFSYMYEPN